MEKQKWEVQARIIVEAESAEAAQAIVQFILDAHGDRSLPHGRRIYDSFVDSAQQAEE